MQSQLLIHTCCLGNLWVDLLYSLILSYGLFGLIQRMSTTQRNTPSHLGPTPLWHPPSVQWAPSSRTDPFCFCKPKPQTLAMESSLHVPWRISTHSWHLWCHHRYLGLHFLFCRPWLCDYIQCDQSDISFLRTGKHVRDRSQIYVFKFHKPLLERPILSLRAMLLSRALVSFFKACL